MRIADARARLVRLVFARPVRTSAGEFDGRSSVLLELADDDGLRGFGEAAPWPGFGTETAEESLAALEGACALVRGLDLEPGDWPPEVALRLRNAPAARAALQGALWDLSARRAGVPLARHLAGRVAAVPGRALESVEVHALLLARTPDELHEEAARARRAGFGAVKIKLGAGPLDDDVARARAARAGLGREGRLRGDANGAWNAEQAVAALDALGEYEFDYVEQPLPAGDLAGLAGLRRRSLVSIAVDESVATEDGALRAIALGSAEVFVLKPATLGGPARALEIAAMAREAGHRVVFSHALESAVGAHHALHSAAAFGDATAVHGLSTAGLFVGDLAAAVDAHDGRVWLPPGPGLGVSP